MNQFLATRNMDSTGIGIPSVQFNHMLLKAFNDFTEQFEFLYNAQYPEPSRNAIEIAILKRKTLNNELEPAGNDINLCE